MILEMSQQSQVYLPMKMRHKIARQPSTKASIDKWFSSAAAKSEVTRGYENQEHFSVLLGQTYLVAGVIRPRVQATASHPNLTPAVATDGRLPDPGTGGDSTEARPLEVLDSDDELFLELDLTPEQEERIRRRFTRIRSETSSSSSQ